MKYEKIYNIFDFIPCEDQYEGVSARNDVMQGDCEPSGSGVVSEGKIYLGDCELPQLDR